MKILDFTLGAINKTTYYQLNRYNSLRTQIEKYIADIEKKERLEKQKCPVCYYLDRGALAGQAFTEYTCRSCGQKLMHPNTNVDALCIVCAKRHLLCVHCGSDLDLAKRTKL